MNEASLVRVCKRRGRWRQDAGVQSQREGRSFSPCRRAPAGSRTVLAGMSLSGSLDKETPGGHVAPPVPPETYRWEELRRQRALGGYPWSHLDKPPLGSRDHLNDHEYEPINPRPQPVATPAVVEHKDVDMEVDVATPASRRRGSETSSFGSGDPNFIRISLHEDADKEALKDEAVGGEEKQLTPQELQTQMEERYFAATPTTTESRTDCDVNTSQLDSSGLEDLPLKRGSRKKKQLEEGETPTRGFQQRIRSQAGRLRAKLRSMKMPERPKFNMPDRPKFNMPERPKFNMPERPKFNMPERPKFNLPDRPKFSMPERPKFNFPERPKFNMPSMPSFSRTKPVKATSSLRRPLRDRATNPSTESNASSTKKSTLFDFDFRTYPRIFDRSRRKYATSSPKSTPRSQTPPPDMGSAIKPTMPRKKGPVGSRWVHRFSDIKYADDEENKPESDLRYRRGDSPDVRVIRLRDSTDEDRDEREEIEELEAREAREEREDVLRRRRMQGYDTEVRDAVEELERQKQERDSFHTDSTSAFHDKDYGYAVTIVENKTPLKEESFPDSDKEQRSSGSSSDRHRAGVLEEIDSDEFFLREKGISREDVDVERYLTSEIRDAFRSPENALSKMDDKYYYDDDEEADRSERREFGEEADIEPVPPVRSKSLQKPKRKGKKAPITPEEDTTNFFNTFPPSRPKRNRRYNEETSREEALIEEEPELAQPTFLITQPTEVSFEEERNYRNKLDDDEWQDEDTAEITPPTAPRRARRSRQETAPASSYRSEHVPEAYHNGLTNGHHDEDEDDHWQGEHDDDDKAVRQEIFAQYMESDYIIPQAPETPPVAPKRGRRHASRGPSVHSLADEDATSRGADSLPSEREPADLVVAAAAHEFPRIGTVQLRDDDLGESGGYATVEKIYPAKPARASRPKPPRPPPPARKKRFFSLPRRTHAPPTRPLRNYSTLGPSRPARRERAQRQGRADAEDDYSRSAHEDVHGSNRDLSSGEVIEKMKGRPLPAPPRPPRKGRDTREGSAEQGGDDEEVSESVPSPEVGAALGALNDNVFYHQKEGGEQVTFASAETRRSVEALSRLRDEQQAFLAADPRDMEVEEVSIATQTDPLPDDFCMEVDDEEPKAQADACTETPGPDVRQTGHDTATTSSSEDRTSEASQVAKAPVAVEEVQRATVAPQVHEEPPNLPPRAAAPSPKPEPVQETAVKPEPVKEPAAKPEPVKEPAVKSDTVQEPVVKPEPVQEPVQEPLPVKVQSLSQAETVPVVVPTASSVAPAPIVQEATAMAPAAPEAQATAATQPAVAEAGPSTPSPVHTTTIIERQVPVYIMPDEHTIIELKAQRLQVSELDVEKLNVGEISAHKILVSDIDGVSMQVAELTSKSGKLMVNGIELPPGFLQEIYDAFPRPSVVQPEPEPAAIPPPPPPTPSVVTPPPVFPPPAAAPEPPAQQPMVPPLPLHIPIEQMYSFIPSAMRVPRSRHQEEMDSEEEMLSFVPASHRRRRHHAAPKHVTRYSSDEEEEAVSFVPRRQARGEASTSGEPTVVELGRQLVTAVQGSSLRAMRSMLQYTASAFEGEDKRRELQTAICILLVLVAGLILMGYGTGKTQHHHHWDYFNPPNN